MWRERLGELLVGVGQKLAPKKPLPELEDEPEELMVSGPVGHRGVAVTLSPVALAMIEEGRSVYEKAPEQIAPAVYATGSIQERIALARARREMG